MTFKGGGVHKVAMPQGLPSKGQNPDFNSHNSTDFNSPSWFSNGEWGRVPPLPPPPHTDTENPLPTDVQYTSS